MIKKIFFSFLLLFIGSLAYVSQASAYDVPAYDGLVNDYADVLSTKLEDQLETELQKTAEATDGAEIAVATIKSLDGDNVENVTQEFFDSWKIGKKHLDNGVLLLIAVEDRKIRIHTGYGAESVITDAEAGRIIRNVITPEFKTGDYEAGIIQGVAAIQQQFVESPGFAPGIDPINKNPDLIDSFFKTISTVMGAGFIMVLLIYFGALFGRSKAWWPGGLVGFGLGLIFSNILTGIFLGMFGLILDYILSKNYKEWSKKRKPRDWKSTWGGFKSSSSSGSSSSGSSFSSGGGSSGGGGASGGW